jgi:predicted flap endonuclease-1-like 5' DNA nuclease
MMTLIAANALPLFLALLIGLATGWWIWARHRVGSDVQSYVSYEDGYAVDTPKAETIAPIVVAPVLTATTPPKAKRAPKIPEKQKLIEPRQSKSTKPKSALTAIGIPAAIGTPDDLLQIKGVGPKLNALLIGLGVTRFDQIAAWKAKEIGIVDGHLGSFKGRITRDEWIDQAELLAMGKIATFEARFGKLDSEN